MLRYKSKEVGLARATHCPTSSPEIIFLTATSTFFELIVYYIEREGERLGEWGARGGRAQLLTHGDIRNLQNDMRHMSSRQLHPDLTLHFTY